MSIPADGATPSKIKAERARRRAAGEYAGYGSLAKRFRVSESTIRRRLGKIP